MLGVLRSVLWSALGTGTWAACTDSCKVQAGPVCRGTSAGGLTLRPASLQKLAAKSAANSPEMYSDEMISCRIWLLYLQGS